MSADANGNANGADDQPSRTIVQTRIHEQLEGREVHGIAITHQHGDTVYGVVSSSGKNDAGLETVDLRTFAYDRAAESVNVTKNGLWVTGELEHVVENLIKLFARTHTDIRSTDEAEIPPPVTTSAVDGVDVSELLAETVPVDDRDRSGQYVSQMRKHGGIDPSRPWGYGAGPPPEIERLAELFADAGLDLDEHTHRLVFGKKEPMDRVIRPVADLRGNYGLETLPRDSGIVFVDVDYADEFPDDVDLPETFAVESPHGGRHLYFYCEDKGEIASTIGAWAVQSVPWGDLWIGDRYVVGPGSQLSEYGCSDGDHEVGEPGGCAACEAEDGGYYSILEDVPIASVEPEKILALVPPEVLEDAQLRNERTAPDAPESDDLPVLREGDPDPPERDMIVDADGDQLRALAAPFADLDRDASLDELRQGLMSLRNRWEGGDFTEEQGVEVCDNCGARRPPDAIKELGSRQICRGGCET